MKKIFQSSFLALSLVFTGCSAQDEDKTTTSGSTNTVSTAPAKVTPILKDISVIDAQELMKTEKNLLLLDVRTPSEVANGKIKGATSYDYNDPSFADQISNLPKDEPWLVYCAAGGRSKKASEIMSNAGFTKVYNLQGGLGAWQAAGLPLEK